MNRMSDIQTSIATSKVESHGIWKLAKYIFVENHLQWPSNTKIYLGKPILLVHWKHFVIDSNTGLKYKSGT